MEKGTKEAKLNPLQEKLKETEANYKLAKTELELLLRNSGVFVALKPPTRKLLIWFSTIYE